MAKFHIKPNPTAGLGSDYAEWIVSACQSDQEGCYMMACLSCISCENWQSHTRFKQTLYIPRSIFTSENIAKSNSTSSALGLGSAGAKAPGCWTAASIYSRVLQNQGRRAYQSSHKAHNDFGLKEKESKSSHCHEKAKRMPSTPCITIMVLALEARQSRYKIQRYSI